MIDVVLEFLQLGYEKWSPERRSPELERRKREGDNEWKPAVDEFNDRLKRYQLILLMHLGWTTTSFPGFSPTRSLRVGKSLG